MDMENQLTIKEVSANLYLWVVGNGGSITMKQTREWLIHRHPEFVDKAEAVFDRTCQLKVKNERNN